MRVDLKKLADNDAMEVFLAYEEAGETEVDYPDLAKSFLESVEAKLAVGDVAELSAYYTIRLKQLFAAL